MLQKCCTLCILWWHHLGTRTFCFLILRLTLSYYPPKMPLLFPKVSSGATQGLDAIFRDITRVYAARAGGALQFPFARKPLLF
jgi:hypothetical protein